MATVLYDDELPGTRRTVWAEVTSAGAKVYGKEVGENAPGGKEYEWSYTIDEADIPLAATALGLADTASAEDVVQSITDRFSGYAYSEFAPFFKEHKVPVQFWQWF